MSPLHSLFRCNLAKDLCRLSVSAGSELEIPGYGCEDHFLEIDTVNHSWEVLAQLLSSDLTDNILCDFGVPAMHKSVGLFPSPLHRNCGSLSPSYSLHLSEASKSLDVICSLSQHA